MFIKIMYLQQIVSDQDKALEFYLNLGFEKKIDYPGPEGRFLTVGYKGQDIELILWKGVLNGQNLSSIFIESNDLKKDFEILKAKGVEFLQPAPEDYPFGVRISALDPDGNQIELRQRKK